MEIVLPANGWAPRDYQLPAWNALESGINRVSLWFPRRSGKDELGLHRSACAAWERVGTYWYMLPEYAQARKVIWDAINPVTKKRRIDDAFPPELRELTRDTDMFIRFKNGSTWQLIGSDNFSALLGAPPVGIVFSEWARADANALGYLSPILAENGGWALFITTPYGKNHAYRMHQSMFLDSDAYAQTLTADSIGVYSSEVLASEQRRLIDVYGAHLGESLFRQEYYCDPTAATVGSIYGAEISQLQADGRFTKVAPVMAPVHTAWDLGHSDATAIWWFQVVGGEFRILDYQQDTLRDLGWYSEQIKGLRIHTPLAAWAYGHEPIKWGDAIVGLEARRSYAYGTHYLPHDAEHRTLSASGMSVCQILGKSIGNVEVVGETMRGLDEAARSSVIAMLRKAWVDKKAASGLELLSEYHYKFDEERRTMSEHPVHDGSSHACLPGDSLVRLERGIVPIANVVVGDRAWTPSGYAVVDGVFCAGIADELVEIEMDDGRILRCTPEHKILCSKGFHLADAVRYNDSVYSGEEFQCRVITYLSAHIGIGFRDTIISGTIQKGVLGFCIGMYGKASMALSRKASACIMSITTRATMTFRTFSACLYQIMRGIIQGFFGKELLAMTSLEGNMKVSHISGTEVQREESSLLRSIRKTGQPENMKDMISLHSTRGVISGLKLRNGGSFAGRLLKNVLRAGSLSHQARRLWLSLRNGIALKRGGLGIVSTLKRSQKIANGMNVCVNVAGRFLCRLTLNVPNGVQRVVRVRRVPYGDLVFDLSVSHHHCYQAGEILVSNSDAARTMALAGHRASYITSPDMRVPDLWDLQYELVR